MGCHWRRSLLCLDPSTLTWGKQRRRLSSSSRGQPRAQLQLTCERIVVVFQSHSAKQDFLLFVKDAIGSLFFAQTSHTEKGSLTCFLQLLKRTRMPSVRPSLGMPSKFLICLMDVAMSMITM